MWVRFPQVLPNAFITQPGQCASLPTRRHRSKSDWRLHNWLFEQKLALVSIVGCHPTSFHETVEWWVFRAREGISRKMPGCPVIGSGKSPRFGNPAPFQLAEAVHVVALSRKQCMLDRFHALKVGVRALKWAIAISMLALISVSRRQQLRGVVYVSKADAILYRMLQYITDSCRKSRNNHLTLSKTLTAKIDLCPPFGHVA